MHAGFVFLLHAGIMIEKYNKCESVCHSDTDVENIKNSHRTFGYVGSVIRAE